MMPGHASMGSHHPPKFQTDTWLTPPEIIESLGPFDFDPCAAPIPRPFETASTMLTRPDDGLVEAWRGRVWLNPPYGGPNIITPWMRRMAEHDHGTALIFARTETAMFHEYVWGCASAVFFFKGRLHFHYPDGTRAAANAGAPSCLVAYGIEDAHRLKKYAHPGKFLPLK